MALTVVRSQEETLLDLKNPEEGLFAINHIFEPEYHLEEYASVCERTARLKGAFQVANVPTLVEDPHRGTQPSYADDEDDPSTLEWEGMILPDGSRLDGANGKRNVCALKSNCIRFGYIDLGLARSVPKDFYQKNKDRAGVRRHDVLVNSTGDGTIGRVAVFNYEFPALVDGHITIIRLKDPEVAWYLAAYLLSEDGQKQIYRYINGSSGQVEIYPQDIERIWIKPAPRRQIARIAKVFRLACEKQARFYRDLKAALGSI